MIIKICTMITYFTTQQSMPLFCLGWPQRTEQRMAERGHVSGADFSTVRARQALAARTCSKDCPQLNAAGTQYKETWPYFFQFFTSSCAI